MWEPDNLLAAAAWVGSSPTPSHFPLGAGDSAADQPLVPLGACQPLRPHSPGCVPPRSFGEKSGPRHLCLAWFSPLVSPRRMVEKSSHQNNKVGGPQSGWNTGWNPVLWFVRGQVPGRAGSPGRSGLAEGHLRKHLRALATNKGFFCFFSLSFPFVQWES